jgi:hypothetical protein
MKRARLEKLAALTRGAAVVGIGLGLEAGTSGCTKAGSDPTPPVINAPATVTPETTNAPPASGSVPVRHFPVPNAMPPRFRRDAGSGEGGAGDPDGP